MSQLRWNVVFQQGEKWIRLEKTYYKVFENAQKKADEWQREFPNLVVRVRQYPPMTVQNGVHMLFGKPQFPGKKLVETIRLDPVPPVPRIGPNDLMPQDMEMFNDGGIKEYFESARWSGCDVIVTWNADGGVYSSYAEDQYGRRKGKDVNALTMVRALESIGRD